MKKQVWPELQQGSAPQGLGWFNRHRIVINPDYRELLEMSGLDSVQRIVDYELGDVVGTDNKQEKNAVRRIEISHQGRVRVLFLKTYWNYAIKSIWQRAFRGSFFGRSMVRAEYENLEQLAQWGFDVPGLVGYGEHRFAGAVIHAFIITEEIPQAMGVDFLFHDWFDLQGEAVRLQMKEQLVEAIASAVRRMHEHGFEHHDLFLRNLMISGQDMSKVYIMDAPRGFFWPGFIMRKRRTFDLATLDAAASKGLTRTQRLRFMHIYLQRDRLTAEDKRLVRQVLARSEPMREKQLKRLARSIAVDENGKPVSG